MDEPLFVRYGCGAFQTQRESCECLCQACQGTRMTGHPTRCGPPSLQLLQQSTQQLPSQLDWQHWHVASSFAAEKKQSLAACAFFPVPHLQGYCKSFWWVRVLMIWLQLRSSPPLNKCHGSRHGQDSNGVGCS